MINSISSAGTALAASQVRGKDADGDNDGSKAPAAAAGANIGPAVIVNLSGGNKPDMAQGDPDHDGK